MEFMANFLPNVDHVQGKYNPADVLSRPPHEHLMAQPDLGRGNGAPFLVHRPRYLD
jgi:hypothetical protein